MHRNFPLTLPSLSFGIIFFFLNPGSLNSRIELQAGESLILRQIIRGLNKYYDFNLTFYNQLFVKKWMLTVFITLLELNLQHFCFTWNCPLEGNYKPLCLDANNTVRFKDLNIFLERNGCQEGRQSWKASWSENEILRFCWVKVWK